MRSVETEQLSCFKRSWADAIHLPGFTEIGIDPTKQLLLTGQARAARQCRQTGLQRSRREAKLNSGLSNRGTSCDYRRLA
jgi:hypothetical protein